MAVPATEKYFDGNEGAAAVQPMICTAPMMPRQYAAVPYQREAPPSTPT